MTPTQARSLTDLKGWFRYWMPYAYVQLPHPTLKHVYLPVNRRYKPLGMTSTEWIDYEPHQPQAVVFSSDPKAFTGIWSNQSPHLYLYDDTPDTRATYFARFERLMAKKQDLVASRIAGSERWPPSP